MKNTTILTTTMLSLLADPLAHAAEQHDHESPKEHVHEKHVTQGPNGGHVIKSKAGFAFEVTVDKERRARIVFLNADLQAIDPADASITGIAGERSAPTKLVFAKGFNHDSQTLISDQSLPQGAHVPMILMIKISAEAKPTTERFELHLH